VAITLSLISQIDFEQGTISGNLCTVLLKLKALRLFSFFRLSFKSFLPFIKFLSLGEDREEPGEEGAAYLVLNLQEELKLMLITMGGCYLQGKHVKFQICTKFHSTKYLQIYSSQVLKNSYKTKKPATNKSNVDYFKC